MSTWLCQFPPDSPPSNPYPEHPYILTGPAKTFHTNMVLQAIARSLTLTTTASGFDKTEVFTGWVINEHAITELTIT